MGLERVGGYEVLCRLGQGGMGEVHLARDGGGRIVALKVMHASIAAEDVGRLRFEREVAAVRRMRSPYVAEIVEAELSGPMPYLATKYVQGRSLHQVVQENGPLGPAELSRLGIGLAKALRAIHDAEVVHRDLKPHNIMIADGDPVVIDLGIALLQGVTRVTHGAIGTVGYMAPEVLEGRAVGPSADVFGWGTVMVFAATGRSCFEADSNAAVNHRVLCAEPDLDGVPPELLSIIRRALAKDPQGRPSVQTLMDAATSPRFGEFTLAYEEAVAAGDHGRAEGLAFGLHTVAVAARHWEIAARSLLDQAKSARNTEAYDRAEELFERAREAAARVGARRDEGWAVDGIGVCQNRRKDFEAAERSFGTALQIAEEVGDAELRAWNLCNLGEIGRRRGDLPAAVRRFEESQQAAENLPHIAMYALKGKGHCKKGQGEFDQAEAAFETARQIALRIDDRHEAGWLWHDLGHCAQARKDFERAAELFGRARDQAVRLGNHGMQGWSLCSLAECAGKYGDEQAAAECYRQAYQLATFMGDEHLLTCATDALAAIDAAH